MYLYIDSSVKLSFSRVAVKIEKPIKNKTKTNNVTQLQNEYNVLSRLNTNGNPLLIFHDICKHHYLASVRGVPEVFYLGECGKARCLVMQKLGPNLEDLLQFWGGRLRFLMSLIF